MFKIFRKKPTLDLLVHQPKITQDPIESNADCDPSHWGVNITEEENFVLGHCAQCGRLLRKWPK